MIVLVLAAIVGGALAFTLLVSAGLALALLAVPIGGSLAAALAVLLLVFQPPHMKAWPWETKL